MADQSENIDKLIGDLARQTHAGTAMLLSAPLEQALQWIIEGNMPNLSNTTRPKLFEGMGPLSHFSAKIDVGFALGFISAREKQVLHAIRVIRNEFFARLEPVAATGIFGADQTLESVTHKITMRWRPDVASGMRLARSGRVFDIVTVHDPDETGRYLVCRTKEVGL